MVVDDNDWNKQDTSCRDEIPVFIVGVKKDGAHTNYSDKTGPTDRPF